MTLNRKIIDRFVSGGPWGIRDDSRTTQHEKIRITRWGKQDIHRAYDPLTNNPAIGVRNGQSLAKNDDHGRIPSRPSSWTSLPCINKAAKLFPKVDNAMMKLSTCGHWPSIAWTITFQQSGHIPFLCLDRGHFERRVRWDRTSLQCF
jgi:hypothetical protein